jgi:hypothetical protein
MFSDDDVKAQIELAVKTTGFENVDQLSRKIKTFTDQMDAHNRAMQNLGQQAGVSAKEAEKAIDALGIGTFKLGANLSTAFGAAAAAIPAFTIAAVKGNADIERGFTRIAAVTGATAEQLKGLRHVFEELSQVTGEGVRNLQVVFRDFAATSNTTLAETCKLFAQMVLGARALGIETSIMANIVSSSFVGIKPSLESVNHLMAAMAGMGPKTIEAWAGVARQVGSSLSEIGLKSEKNEAQLVSLVDFLSKNLGSDSAAAQGLKSFVDQLANMQSGLGGLFLQIQQGGGAKDALSAIDAILAKLEEYGAFLDGPQGRAVRDSFNVNKDFIVGLRESARELHNIEKAAEDAGVPVDKLQTYLRKMTSDSKQPFIEMVEAFKQLKDTFGAIAEGPIVRFFQDLVSVLKDLKETADWIDKKLGGSGKGEAPGSSHPGATGIFPDNKYFNLGFGAPSWLPTRGMGTGPNQFADPMSGGIFSAAPPPPPSAPVESDQDRRIRETGERYLRGRRPPGHATGGPVGGGQPFMVGEEGPEIIAPMGEGYVLPRAGTEGSSAASADYARKVQEHADRQDAEQRKHFASLRNQPAASRPDYPRPDYDMLPNFQRDIGGRQSGPGGGGGGGGVPTGAQMMPGGIFGREGIGAGIPRHSAPQGSPRHGPTGAPPPGAPPANPPSTGDGAYTTPDVLSQTVAGSVMVGAGGAMGAAAVGAAAGSGLWPGRGGGPGLAGNVPGSAIKTSGNNVDSVSLYQNLVQRFTQSSLNGYVPPDGSGTRYGITTGSPQEWARLATALASQETSFRVSAHELGHGGHLAGLYQFGPTDLQRRGLGTDITNVDHQVTAMIGEFEKIKRDKSMAPHFGGNRWGGAADYFGPFQHPHQVLKHMDEAQRIAQKAGATPTSTASSDGVLPQATQGGAAPSTTAGGGTEDPYFGVGRYNFMGSPQARAMGMDLRPGQGIQQFSTGIPRGKGPTSIPANKYAGRDIAGFLHDLYMAGAPLKDYNGVYVEKPLQHGYGNAVDIERGLGSGPDNSAALYAWAQAHPQEFAEIQARHHMRNLDTTSGATIHDWGHFEWSPQRMATKQEMAARRLADTRVAGPAAPTGGAGPTTMSTAQSWMREAAPERVHIPQVGAPRQSWKSRAEITPHASTEHLQSQTSDAIHSYHENLMQQFKNQKARMSTQLNPHYSQQRAFSRHRQQHIQDSTLKNERQTSAVSHQYA